MIRFSSIFPVLLALLLPLGCRRDTDVPPRHLAMGGNLIPVRIPESIRDEAKTRSILGSAARPEELTTPKAAASVKAATTIKVDDATADEAPDQAMDVGVGQPVPAEGEPAEAEPADEEKAAEEEPKAKPEPPPARSTAQPSDERNPVDDVYVGPGQLRKR